MSSPKKISKERKAPRRDMPPGETRSQEKAAPRRAPKRSLDQYYL
jgi:hypothetical protein